MVYDCLILVEITVLMAALVTYYSTVCSHWRAAVMAGNARNCFCRLLALAVDVATCAHIQVLVVMLLTVVVEPVAVLVCCGRVGLHRADPSVGVMCCRHPPDAMRSLLECLSYLFLQQLRGVAWLLAVCSLVAFFA